MKKDSKSIDVMKFVFALCVVTIHCYIVDLIRPTLLQHIVNVVIRESVPFFFVVSAYFMVKKVNVVSAAGTSCYWGGVIR